MTNFLGTINPKPNLWLGLFQNYYTFEGILT